MASLNKSAKNKMETTNKSGHDAYKLDDKTRLVTMALTTMLGEPKYYGDNTDALVKLAEKLCKEGEGEFVAKLAVWARTTGNLRSVSHALVAVTAHLCPCKSDGRTVSFVRLAARDVASVRGDDGTEILATGIALYGKGFKGQNALRRGIRDALEKESPFQVAKYQSRNKDLKLRDNLRITHPNAVRDDTTKAMGEVIEDKLGVPKGWETELSERGNTKEVWDELIAENRLGIFAQLRNLRNMIQAGADIDPVLMNFHSEGAVRKSRILPFRFYSAYRELQKAGLATTKVTKALDAAMRNACANVDPLPGKTAVLIDTSGSMDYSISAKSVSTCRDIAAVLGAMSTHISLDAWVCGFDLGATVIPMAGVSILSDIAMVPHAGGCTNMAAGFQLLMKSGFDADRIIVLSDNEVNGCGWSSRHSKEVIQECLEQYRKKVGHDVWCHAIDLQGYGTSQFIGPKVNVMAGWSESILRFISMAESGFGSIVNEIDGMEL